MKDSKKTGFWPTPSVANATGGQTSRGGKRKGELLLSGMVRAGVEPLTSSLEDSHARTSVSPESNPALTGRDPVYGLSAPVLLASCAQSTSSGKMSAHYSQEAIWLTPQSDLFTEHGLAEFCETWPKSGMTVNGTAYRLETLMDYQPERHTDEIGSGLWPTPSANEDAAGTPAGKMQRMLGNCEEVRGKTPEEWKEGQLNPAWVCWLMGLPLDWLDLDGYQNPELDGLPPEYLTESTS